MAWVLTGVYVTTPALILVDLQKDFLQVGEGHVGRVEKAICLPGVRRLLAFARQENWAVIHAITEHAGPDSMPGHLRRKGVRPYCMRDSAGAALLHGMHHPGDKTVTKTHYSAMRTPELRAALETHHHILVAGIAVDCCVMQTAFDLEHEGKEVFIPFQAVGASKQRAYVAGLEMISKSAGTVVDLDKLLVAGDLVAAAELQDDALESRLVPWFDRRAAILQRVRDEYERRASQDGIDAAVAFLESALPSS
jgi:nicotinamidase-related amidase